MNGDRERLTAALPAYEIGQELGRGGFGVVLEGRHRQLGREVAIKQLPRSFGADPEVQHRFLAEARILATLDHPHVVPIYDYVETNGVCVLVMEKLSGGTLWERFSAQGLAPQTACAAILASCAGLHSAHTKGILHRDVKPENLIFSSTGTLKVTDFGISKMLAGTTTKATAAGEILGTPAYMAPEQAEAGELTPATDVYAVGVMLYELLSGHLPFSEEGGLVALLYQRVHEDPRPLEEIADVPLPLADVTMQALERDPAERYSSAEELGVAVAEAATAVWGPGWLSTADLPVLAASEMISATERGSARGRGTAQRGSPTARSAATSKRAPSTHASAPAPRTGPVSRPSRGTRGPTGAPAPVVRPTVAGHAAGANLSEVNPIELVPASEVLVPPAPPVPHIATAIGLLIIALVLGFVGLGSPERTGELSGVSLAGADVGPEESIKLDLSKPIPVTGAVPGNAAAANTVELSFSAAGIPLGSGTEEVQGGRLPAEIDVTASRFLVPNVATGKLALKQDGNTLADRSFEVKRTSGGYLTAPTAAAIVLAMFALAYTESLLRGLRRGRRAAAATIGVAITGGLVGIVAVLVAWVLGVKEPVPATLVAAAVLGAGSGIAAGLGSARVGRRRRARRTNARITRQFG